MRPKDEAKARDIAKATFALVEETGLSGLTMADIAKRAKIATSTLYIHYSSKEELIVQLHRQTKKLTEQRLIEGYDASAPLRARLRRIWENWLSYRLECYAESIFQEQCSNSPYLTPADREVSLRLSTSLMKLFAEGQAQEILKRVPIELLMASFIGSVRVMATLIRTKALTSGPADRLAAFTVCWDGMKA